MSEKRSDKAVVAMAVALLAVILVGEVVVYTSDYTDYSASASAEDGVITYTVSADGSKSYSVVVSDSNGYEKVTRLYLYYDESYASDVEDVEADVGAPALTQSYYLKQLVQLLEYRGVTDVTYVDAQELAEVLSASVAAGSSAGIGLVCLNGALPDTVYTGNAGDLILTWLESGGSLYWAGNTIGSEYATTEGVVAVEGDYQTLFLGSDCLNTDETLTRAYEEYSGNAYRSALSLSNNNVKYGVSPSMVTSRACLALGYQNGGYASIVAVQCGSGAVFVFGGDYSDYQRYDMAQVIAAGIGPQSELVAVDTGTVTRGSVSGTVEATGSDLTAYIYLGGYYPVYGKHFDLRGG
ncbi:MAG: hypothetical protein Q4Q58_03845 [Thermoplasmata archaeon]|nr:hypothetical protein [Thermoplasmata archaeon]